MSPAHSITTDDGRIEISDDAVEQLVRRAAEAVAGVRVRRARRGLTVAFVDGRARVSLEVAASYGAALPEVARDVQARVADVLTGMCGVRVDAVDVTIEELD